MAHHDHPDASSFTAWDLAFAVFFVAIILAAVATGLLYSVGGVLR